MKKILALALSLAMIVCVLLAAGCGNTTGNETTKEPVKPTETTGSSATDPVVTPPETTKGGEDQPTETTGSTQPAETTAPTTVVDEWDGLTKLPGYEDVDFRGATFVIAANNGEEDQWACDKEVYSEENDTVSVAVRKRNDIMAKLYNCNIQLQSVVGPGALAAADVAGNTHTIDLFTIKYNHGNGANCYNLASFDLDFGNPWWDHAYINSYTHKDANGTKKLFDVLGDFSLSAFRAIGSLIYNRTIYETSGIEDDVYQLVRDKKWTMDKFVEMIKKGAKETSGNSQFSYDEGDIMGWLGFGYTSHCLHAASGLSIFEVVDGEIRFAMSDNSSAWSDVIDKAIEVYNTTGAQCGASYTKVHDGLKNGTILFASEVLGTLEVVKDADVQLGLLPYPLYSESQENYAHYVDNHGMRYAVPVSVPDTDVIADFLELYAAHSRYIVRPAWIDTYSYEYCSDADSGEMLNIILDTRTYDLGYLSFNKEGEISGMISSGKNNIVKWIDRNKSNIDAAIQSRVNYLGTVGN